LRSVIDSAAALADLVRASAFGKKILDISEGQAETMVCPDGIANVFCRETMTVIARPVALQGPVFQFAAQVDNAS
jgi:hypothetical protein